MGPTGPWAHENAEWLSAMSGHAGSGTGSARPFPSEPEGPQGEEGVASRASRHENAEALVFASFFLYFHPIFRFKGGGVSRNPSRSTTPGTR